ncbi:MAG: low molecular weight protein-tyrosine-phosphatase [Limnohabitans sp.]
MSHRYRLTFVCMGNICRSPTADGVMRHQVAARHWQHWIEVDSAGTHAYHVGEAPDARSQQHARQRGYDLSMLRARQLVAEVFERSDLVLVMDWDNLALAEELCPPAQRHKLRRLTEFCLRHDSPVVPDPYHGGAQGFEHVLDLVEDACEGLLQHLAGLPAKPAPR